MYGSNGYTLPSAKKLKGSQRQKREDQVETYIVGLEQDLRNLQDQLKKATDETKSMKKINKELLESLQI